MIPADKWEWSGYAGHHICANECRFRLNTKVGDYMISTVGDLRMANGKRDCVGDNRTFETLVFKTKPCDCGQTGCDLWAIEDPCEVFDFAAYNDEISARHGHMAMCRKYAEMQGEGEE